MGRAEITGGGENGLYTAAIKYDDRSIASMRSAIEKELEKIDAQLALFRPRIIQKRIEVSDARETANDYVAAYNQAVTAAFTGNQEQYLHPPPEYKPTYTFEDLRQQEYQLMKASLAVYSTAWDADLAKAFQDLARALAVYNAAKSELLAMEKEYNLLLFREQELKLKQGELSDTAADGDPQSMWCADLSEELSGEVDTIEINGAPIQVLIQPGGTGALLDKSGTSGKLARVMGQSYAQAGLAWALLPGWQKWRPTYRVGDIHDIDYDADTASVSLDGATSIAQGLGVNQADELMDIPVEYMECDSKAFENGDRVVVEFPGQVWGTGPKVIGFETNPKPCGASVYVCGYHDMQNRLVPGRVTAINKSGETLWSSRVSDGEYVVSLGASNEGIYAGNSKDEVEPYSSGILTKFNPDSGIIEWEITGLWALREVAAGPTGVVCGLSWNDISWGGEPGSDSTTTYVMVRKYSHGGSLLWSSNWVNPGHTFYSPPGIDVLVLDEEDNIYCGGLGSSGSFFSKRTPSGNIVWEQTYAAVERKWVTATVARDGYVHALEAGQGGQVIKFPTGIPPSHPFSVDIRQYGSVAVSSKGVSFGSIGPTSSTGEVVCLNLSGSAIWQANTGHYLVKVATFD